MPGYRAQVEYGTSANALDSSVSGSAKKYVQDYTTEVYVSGVMHHAKLEGLQPLTTYFYRRACVSLPTSHRCHVSVMGARSVCLHNLWFACHATALCSLQAGCALSSTRAPSPTALQLHTHSCCFLLRYPGAAMQR